MTKVKLQICKTSWSVDYHRLLFDDLNKQTNEKKKQLELLIWNLQQNKLSCILSDPFFNVETCNVGVLNTVLSKISLKKVCPNLT